MIYQHYQTNIEQAQREIQRLNKAVNQNSFARLFVIIGGGALLFYTFSSNSVLPVIGVILAIVLLFAYSVRRQSLLEKQRDHQQAYLLINENEIQLKEQRNTMYDDGGKFGDGRHPYSADLATCGQLSLFSLVNRCATKLGVDILAGWFQKAAPKETIRRRQAAVAELAEDIHWSQAFQSKLVFNLQQQTEVKSYLARYFRGSGLTFGNAAMKYYVQAAPFLLLAAVLFSLLVFPIWSWIAMLALAHLCWTLAMAGKVSHFSSKIDKVGQMLAAYAEGLVLIEDRKFTAAENIRLQKQLFIADRPLSDAFRELSKLINNLDARNNMLVGAVLNMIFLWDFKYVLKIVRWKSLYEENILIAFDIIASFESLNSLAILKRNHPSWATP